MKIHIIAAALPPKLDGIGDYTANLAAELAKSATVTILTGAPQPDPVPGVRVETAFCADDPPSVRQIISSVKADKPDWVLLQYQPFSYGRWGLNLYLPEVIRHLRTHTGVRVALMVHEPFVPIITPQFAVMATWQRWQLWRLGQNADVIFFSIEPWAGRFSKWFPRKQVLHLPVGSNIPLVSITRIEARERLGIPEATFVLGLFGTIHVSRMLDRVHSVAQAVRKTGSEMLVLYIGPDKQSVCSALKDIPIMAEGPFPGEEISRRFAAMDVHLSPFTDGISTRRGSVMCGLQHGIATVGTRGYLTDPILKEQDGQAFLLADADAPEKFNTHVLRLIHDVPLREQLGQNARQLYEKEFAWPRIATRLRKALTTQERAAQGSLAASAPQIMKSK